MLLDGSFIVKQFELESKGLLLSHDKTRPGGP